MLSAFVVPGCCRQQWRMRKNMRSFLMNSCATSTTWRQNLFKKLGSVSSSTAQPFRLGVCQLAKDLKKMWKAFRKFLGKCCPPPLPSIYSFTIIIIILAKLCPAWIWSSGLRAWWIRLKRPFFMFNVHDSSATNLRNWTHQINAEPGADNFCYFSVFTWTSSSLTLEH